MYQFTNCHNEIYRTIEGFSRARCSVGPLILCNNLLFVVIVQDNPFNPLTNHITDILHNNL